MGNDLSRVDVSVPPIDSLIPGQGGLSRVVIVSTPLDILQAQEAVLAFGGSLGFASHDINAVVAAVSRMASALLTYSGEATMRFAPAKRAAGLEVEGQGGVVQCESDRRRIAASVVRLLSQDDWSVPSDGGPRVSARKTFLKKGALRAWTRQPAC